MKTYYYLPTDNYGQPDGNIVEVTLTPDQYEQRKANGEYIYDNYYSANCRAND
jgi:hypothetical protein